MLVLQPYPHETIWGGDKLQKYCSTASASVGHLYSAKGTLEESNVILNGSYKGTTFYSYFVENKHLFDMEEYDRYPITVALVDAANDLSVQVHPSADMAWELEGVRIGKNESFYVLETTGFFRAGCSCSDGNELQRLLKDKLYDDIMGTYPVRQGDYIYVPEGTLHSLSAGTLAYEIEETCDFTYRLHDYDRTDTSGNKRPVDTSKAIKCIDFFAKPVISNYKNGEIKEKRYITVPLYCLEDYVNNSETIECVTVLSGNGECDGVRVHMGVSIILEPLERLELPGVDFAIAARTIK